MMVIRIYHECIKGRVEKSLHKVHRLASRGLSSDGFIYCALTRLMDSFSCSPLFCIFK